MRLLRGRFQQSSIAPLQTAVRFLSPDIAVIHWSWTLAGDKNPDGTARERRYGMMTMVAALIATLQPRVVVAGHKKNASVPDSPLAVYAIAKGRRVGP